MTTPATAETIAQALGQVTVSAAGYKCRCPAHEDSRASLQINVRGNGDGRPTVHCFAGCAPQSIFKSIEEQTGFHFEAREMKSNRTQDKIPSIYPAPIDWQPIRYKQMAPVKHWKYFNADGELMFAVHRYDSFEGKVIRPYSVQDRNGNHVWGQGLGGLYPLPMYNLTEVLARPTDKVLIVEGEKACDAAKTIPELADFVVLAYQGGAKTWKKTDWSPLKGRSIFLWPDNDDAGNVQFMDLAKYLNLDQFCQDVRVAIVPKTWPEKWDLADPLPSGAAYSDVSWMDAPQGGSDFILDSITPANYVEAFDSMYWLVYDGSRHATVSKQRWVNYGGRPIEINESLQSINPYHEAYKRCFIGRESALTVWANETHGKGNFYRGFRFRPDIEGAIIADEAIMDKYLNSFTGFGFKPDPYGDCTIVKNHIFNIICDGDRGAYDYLWNYIAHMMQFPGNKPNVAIIFKGKHGVGKSILFSALAELLGGLTGYASKLEGIDQATGRFNSYITQRLLVWIEEMNITASRTKENRLKTLITDSFVHVERKGKDGYNDLNFIRYMGSTNHEHVWNLAQDDRRIVVLEVSQDRQNDSQYFTALYNAIRDTNVMRRLMYELMSHKVDHFMVMKPFKNKARSKQMLFTMDPNADMMMEFLRIGEISLRVFDERNDVVSSFYCNWRSEPARLPSSLFNEVARYRVKHGKYQEAIYTVQDKRLASSEAARMAGCTETESGGKKRLKYTSGYILHRGSQKLDNMYVLPELNTARLKFCEHHGFDYMDVFGDETDNKVVPLRPSGDSPL